MAEESQQYSCPFINQYVKVPESVSGRINADHGAEYEGVRHCIGLIATNLLSHGNVAYSRNNHHYTENRTRHYTYANMTRAVRIALADGYAVELQKGYWDRGFEKGLSSTLGTGHRLEEFGPPEKLELDVRLLPLLSVDGRPAFDSGDIAYLIARATSVSRESATLMPSLTGFYDEALKLNREYWNKIEVGVQGLSPGQRCMGQVGLTRVFRKGGVGRWFQRGGLSYQELPKIERAKLRINREAVTELDYHAMHPHLLYAWEGRQCLDDFYEMVAGRRGCGRPLAKQLTLMAVNADSYRALVSAVNFGRVQGEEASAYDELKRVGLTPKDVVGALVEVHPTIRKYVYSDQANRLMLAESDIMTAVLLRLMGFGIPALPVHDSVVAPSRHGESVRRVMGEEYRRQTGFDISVA